MSTFMPTIVTKITKLMGSQRELSEVYIFGYHVKSIISTNLNLCSEAAI